MMKKNKRKFISMIVSALMFGLFCSEQAFSFDIFMGFRVSYHPLSIELQGEQSYDLDLLYLGVGGGFRGSWWRVSGEVEAIQDPLSMTWNQELYMQWGGWGGAFLGGVRPFTLLEVSWLEALTFQTGVSFFRLRGFHVGPNITVNRNRKYSEDYEGVAEGYSALLQPFYGVGGILWEVHQSQPESPVSWIQSYGFGARVLVPLGGRYRHRLSVFTGREVAGEKEILLLEKERDYKEISYVFDIRVSLEE